MYFEDLTLCRYHGGALHADNWQAPLLAVGWLEQPHQYPQGVAPSNLAPRLRAFIAAARDVFSDHFRGLHSCTLCPPGVPAADLELSYINLLIPGRRVVFAAPAGILHYITDHSYLPPSEFIEAVNACPTYGTDEHLAALRDANASHPAPLTTDGQNVYIDLRGLRCEEEVLDAFVKAFEFGSPNGNVAVTGPREGWGRNWDAMQDSLLHLAAGGIGSSSRVVRFPLRLWLFHSAEYRVSDPRGFAILLEILEATRKHYASKSMHFAYRVVSCEFELG